MLHDCKAEIHVICTKHLTNHSSFPHRYKVTYDSLMRHWVKTFFQILVYMDVLNFYKLEVYRSLRHVFETPIYTLYRYTYWQLHCTSLHAATARLPIRFRYQRRHLLTDAFLLVHPCDTPLTSWNPTERNLNSSKPLIKWSNPPFRIFQHILLRNSHSKFRYSCPKIWRYAVASQPHSYSCWKRHIL